MRLWSLEFLTSWSPPTLIFSMTKFTWKYTFRAIYACATSETLRMSNICTQKALQHYIYMQSAMAVGWALTVLIFASVSTILVESGLPAEVARTKREEECGGLANSTSQECLRNYSLISPDNSTVDSNDTQTFISNVCEGECGREIYDYLVKCNVVLSGVSSAALLDLVCATPAINGVSDTRCIAVSSSFYDTLTRLSSECTFLAAPDKECDATCNSTIAAQINAMGCCFYTYYGLSLGTNYVNYLFSSCGADITACDGGFSNQTIPLPDSYENYCPEVSINGIPNSCRNFIQFDNILQFASTDPDRFVSSFCEGQCAKPLYDYFKDCDKVSRNSTAPTLDFMCTSNPKGKECVQFISDPSLQQTFDGVCKGIETSDECPTGCSAALQTISNDYGCCFYTQAALVGNVDVDDILHDKCSVETPGLCKKGGISGNVIDAPGGDDTGGNDDTGNASAFKASVTVVFTLLLGTIIF